MATIDTEELKAKAQEISRRPVYLGAAIAAYIVGVICGAWWF